VDPGVALVLETEAELSASRPAGQDIIVGAHGPHQLEGVTRHVLVDGVDERRGAGGAGGGRGGFGARGELLFVLHQQGAHASLVEAADDGVSLVSLGWQDVRNLDEVVVVGDGVESALGARALQDGEQSRPVELARDVIIVLGIAVNLEVEDSNTIGSVVLFDGVEPVLELRHLGVLVAELLLEGGVLGLGGCQHLL